MVIPDEPSLVRDVVRDLVTLTKETDRHHPADRDLRRVAAILRRLLVDDDYGKAWRAAGFEQQPRIPGVDLLHHIGQMDRGHVAWAQAGGGRHQGTRVAPLIVHDRALSPLEVRGTYQRAGMEPLVRYWRVADYLKSPCIAIKALVLDRGHLIQYVADKLQGAGFDAGRSGDDETFLAIDHALETLKVTDKQAPCYELVSMAEDVGHSRDASRLQARAAELGLGPP